MRNVPARAGRSFLLPGMHSHQDQNEHRAVLDSNQACVNHIRCVFTGTNGCQVWFGVTELENHYRESGSVGQDDPDLWHTQVYGFERDTRGVAPHSYRT